MSSDAPSDTGRRVVVMNPASGSGDHASTVRALADERGFVVRETERAGDAVRLARAAADGRAELVAACGGDGTVNEVLLGLDRADGLADVTVGVIPAGTGNNFATNIGLEGIEHAFEVLETGERRWVDLGKAAGTGGGHGDGSGLGAGARPFVNSCVTGFTARASSETTSDMKGRWGTVAYVMNTLRTITDFEGMRLRVDTNDEYSESWHGDAVCVLIGNGRRFPVEGRTQANVEDGLLDVTIVEERPAFDLAGEAAVQRLFGGDTPNIRRLKTPSIDLQVLSGESVEFSLDGEILSARSLSVETRHRAFELCVGEAYEPDPG